MHKMCYNISIEFIVKRGTKMKIRNYLRQEWNMYLRNVLLRDKCEFCGSTENLHVHHENRFYDLFIETLRELEMSELEVEEYPEYDLNLLSNVMLGKQLKIEYKTLCRCCHMKLHMAKKRNGEYNQNPFTQYGPYFFIKFKELKEKEIEGNTLVRFIRLCSYMDYDNRIRLGNAKGKKSLAVKKDLQEILKISERETRVFQKEMFRKELIILNEDKTMVINKKYALKGYSNEIERNIIFENEFNKLYNEIEVVKHKPLGNSLYENVNKEQIFKFDDDKYSSFKHKYRSLRDITTTGEVFKAKGNVVMFNPCLFLFECHRDIKELIKIYKEF